MVVGVAGLSENSPRARAWFGPAYGVGTALVVAEAALLISLEDVYWDTEGGLIIAIAITVIAVAGTVLPVTRGRRASRAEDEVDRKPAEDVAEPRRGDS
ncbi:hypothetical protein [Streptomyces californicus]|uniref:hypothetical protein n=1 Tax=Streptomyces californicus TaxID=67351 RepID=UPI0037AB426C